MSQLATIRRQIFDTRLPWGERLAILDTLENHFPPEEAEELRWEAREHQNQAQAFKDALRRDLERILPTHLPMVTELLREEKRVHAVEVLDEVLNTLI